MKKRVIKSLNETIMETRTAELPALFNLTKELYKYNTHTLPTRMSMRKITDYIYKNDPDNIFDYLYRLKYNLTVNNCDDALKTVSTINKCDKLFLKSEYIDNTLSDIMTDNLDSTDEFVALVVLIRININSVIRNIIVEMKGNDDV